jgi:hypothetical protein
VVTSQFIGHMGVEYNQFGEECESRKEIKREEIRMGWGKSFYTLCFCA